MKGHKNRFNHNMVDEEEETEEEMKARIEKEEIMAQALASCLILILLLPHSNVFPFFTAVLLLPLLLDMIRLSLLIQWVLCQSEAAYHRMLIRSSPRIFPPAP